MTYLCERVLEMELKVVHARQVLPPSYILRFKRHLEKFLTWAEDIAQ
jgi:hypothetical protein